MKLAPAAQRLIGSVTLEHEDGSETTIDISRELVIKARMLGWSGFELMAEAVQAWHRSFRPFAPGCRAPIAADACGDR